eukprot:4353878-Lingulodinium_polyedra.AAC.1
MRLGFASPLTRALRSQPARCTRRLSRRCGGSRCNAAGGAVSGDARASPRTSWSSSASPLPEPAGPG